MQNLDLDKPNKFKIWLKEKRKIELTLTVDFDGQTDERGQNLREKEEKMKRKMLDWRWLF